MKGVSGGKLEESNVVKGKTEVERERKSQAISEEMKRI